MLEFIIQILTRWISGVKQSYFYQKKWYEGLYFTVGMCLFYVLWAVVNSNVIAFIVPVGAIIIYYFLYDAFKTDKTKRIHTLEYLGNYWFNFGAFFLGGDLLGLIMAIYVGDLLFNLPIQKHFTGNYLNKVAITDDPSGKTTNFYIFKLEFKVPNLLSNGYHKLYFAIFCTISYLILWFLEVKLDIHQILDLINFPL